MGKLATADGNGIRIERKGFASLHPAIKRHVLRLVYEEITGLASGLQHRHIEDMVKLSDGGVGRSLDLPSGLVFTVAYDYLILKVNNSGAFGPPALHGEYPLSIPGETRIPGWTVAARLLPYGEGHLYADAYTARMDAERVGRGLHVRGRRRGTGLSRWAWKGRRSYRTSWWTPGYPQTPGTACLW